MLAAAGENQIPAGVASETKADSSAALRNDKQRRNDKQKGTAAQPVLRRLQPVFLRPAEMPLMVAVMARSSSAEAVAPVAVTTRLRRRSSTWMRDMGST